VKGSPHRRRVYKSVTSITTSIATSITSYRKKNPLENESLGVIGDLEQLRKRYSVDHSRVVLIDDFRGVTHPVSHRHHIHTLPETVRDERMP
jgi:hypothetical protein